MSLRKLFRLQLLIGLLMAQIYPSINSPAGASTSQPLHTLDTGASQSASHFNAMFGDGQDGDLIVGPEQTIYTDDVRAAVVGTAMAGQYTVQFALPTTGELHVMKDQPPKQAWVETGLRISVGDRLQIISEPHGHPDLHKVCYSNNSLCYDATGTGDPAPSDWTAPSLSTYSLVAKIGAANPFYVGDSYDATATRNGQLYLALNDCNGCFSDNSYYNNSVGFSFNIRVYRSVTSQFLVGEEVLIIQTSGEGVGNYEFGQVASVSSNSINLVSPLQNTYSANGLSRAQIMYVPNWRNVTVQTGGELTAGQWDGTTGGVIAFRVQNQLTVESGGSISAFSNGFQGGNAVYWDSANPQGYQGHSITGTAPTRDRMPNTGGGGGGNNAGGGAGGFGTAGENGQDYPGGTHYGLGGNTYGLPDLQQVYLGSGGGGTGHAYESAAQGGSGGGIIIIASRFISIDGNMNANGQSGGQPPYSGTHPPDNAWGEGRGGGGGSGGSVRLITESANIGNNLLQATGGQGGGESGNTFIGGIGGNGRIAIEYCTGISGIASPPAFMQELNCLDTRPWTFLVYLNADNDLDDWSDDIFNKLEVAANNPSVKIVVMWDRHPGGTWDDGTCIYEVQFDRNLATLANYTEGVNRRCLQELNLGDKQSLTDFVTWSKADYPADYYFLSIFDHGGGWSPEIPPQSGWIMGGAGLSWDDTDQDYLSNYDLDWVFDTAGPVDVLLYEANLMAMIENALEVSDQVDYLVASQNLEYTFFPYNAYISLINETTTPAGLAEGMVDTYVASLPPGWSGSMVALDLKQTDGVVIAVNQLAQALGDMVPNPALREQIATAYLAAQKLDYDRDGILEPSREGFVDLYDLALQIENLISDPDVVTAAQDLVSALEGGFVMAESHVNGNPYGNGLANIHGVSIYMPFGEELYVGRDCEPQTLDICSPSPGPRCIKVREYYTTTTPPQVTQLQFAQDTGWDEFVNRFIEVYYNCQGRADAGLQTMRPLPSPRPIKILNKSTQRAKVLPINRVYLPLLFRGQ